VTRARNERTELSSTAIRTADYARAPAAGGAPASFRRLALAEFRSWARLDLALDGRPVALFGANGAGKTNILEALSLIGPGRGLRSARLDELPMTGASGGWAVSGTLDGGGGEIRLGVGALAGAPNRRLCRGDETTLSGPSAFAEHVRFVWLTPAQDRLFMDGAGERRRFLDRMGVAHDPGHARALSAYDLAMRQRQRLLETRSRDEAWLSALETQMAETGVAVAAGRRDTAGALVAAAVEDETHFPAAEVALEGDIEAALDIAPAAEVEEEFAARLRDARPADAAARRALIGPHRSDLIVRRRETGRPARSCSTGEQKALLIGLVLANARALALKSRYGARAAPLVLLLDEIAAHLDADRRAALFDIIDGLGFQTFMTGTDQSLFSAWGDRAQAFEIADRTAKETSLG
jgi:DNA replication and repair protein RecF